MNYNFSTLNDKDLEELACDVLLKATNIQFQAFKIGKDQGIDLRYSTSADENNVIVQVKHYVNSSFGLLKRSIRKEAFKVKALAPSRYILVTSLGLTPKNKTELKKILSPYVLTTQDIFGRDDLNNIIRNDPDIETTHFKLWLSSSTVLARILHNGEKGRSEFIDGKIKDRIKIFVPNRTHGQAVDLLNNNNFIVITGAPGIGKTTLANILTYQLLAAGFQLVYVREIKEAEDAYLPGSKQVFYFDDFLGSITLDLHSSRNADSAIVQFLDRVRNDKTKRLILTCRTYILKQAKEISDKISDSKIDLANHEVKIEDYSDLDKAKILYNHVYFSNLTDDLKQIFFQNGFYWEVIKHKFYNPRVIEGFTDLEKVQTDIPYKKEVIAFLDDPARIWCKPYTVQISAHGRLLLNVLFSLGGKYTITEERLKKAFTARYEREVQNNNLEKIPNAFSKVVSELNGGFIIKIIKVKENGNITEYRFFNPSIEDFLITYFNKSALDEFLQTLESAVYYDQFKYRLTTEKDFGTRRIFFDNKNQKRLLEIFMSREEVLKTGLVNTDITAVVILLRLFEWDLVKDIVTLKMNNLRFQEFSLDNREDLFWIMDFLAANDLLKEFSFSLEYILLGLSRNFFYHGEVKQFSLLVEKYEVYKLLVSSAIQAYSQFASDLHTNFEEFWENDADYFFNLNTEGITDREELIEAIALKKREAEQMSTSLGLPTPSAIQNYDFDFDSVIERNQATARQKVSTIQDITKAENLNQKAAVNRLFNAPDDASPHGQDLDALPF